MIFNRFISKQTFRNLLKVYSVYFFTVFFSIISSLLIAKVLIPAEKGIVDAFNLYVALLLELSGVGISSGISHYYNNYCGDRKTFNNTIKIMLVVVMLCFFCLGGCIYFLRGILFDDLFYNYLVYIILMASFLFVRNVSASVLIASGRVLLSHKIGLSYAILLLVMISFLYIMNVKDTSAYIISTVVATFFVALSSVSVLNLNLRDTYYDGHLVKKIFSFGFPIYVGLLINALHFKIDQFFILKMLGTEDLAFYSVSVRWAETIFLFDNLLISFFFSRIVTIEESKSFDLIVKISKVQATLYVIVFVVFVVAMKSALPILYTPDYLRSYAPMIILLMGTIFWSFAKTYSQFITFKKNDNYSPTFYAFVGLIINIFFNIYLIPKYGLWGCAFSSLLSYLAVFALSCRKFYSIKYLAV